MAGVYCNGAIIGGIEPVAAGNRMNVAIENQAHDVPAGVDERAARIAANDVIAGRNAKGCAQVQRALGLHPTVGNPKGRIPGGALEGAVQMG